MNEPRARTKTELTRAVAQRGGLAARDVDRMLEALAEVILEDLSPGGPGAVALAGLIKAEVATQPARAERMGRNPATGETIRIAARLANERGKIRLRALKRLRAVL
ncbi:MAG: DNA-binding protein [Chloroflexi bacterium]|nr:DNA-binding protein [Chloroflexota bacterium]MXY86541.1 DNA-binding protein [Chloroflexota bacterium]MYD73774.1 DNA-binding protein [Chloroflexota bacterium]MYJ58513.1 DNA-binding protein [Chloroflexota bacterium]MYK09823.1 DNA-binding protein [Terriglobia bacterium]